MIKREFDNLTEEDTNIVDMPSDEQSNYFHIFSNVLDINTFDAINLCSRFMKNGKHFIMAVSHNRDFDGGSRRIYELRNFITDNNEYFRDVKTGMYTSKYKQDGDIIHFFAELKVEKYNERSI